MGCSASHSHIDIHVPFIHLTDSKELSKLFTMCWGTYQSGINVTGLADI